jgi:enamine deaminase RidA (YjgF/YER057c/UK114 family)
MPRFFNPSNVPKPASRYTQAIAHSAIYKRLVISGQIGVTADGHLVEGLEAQMEQAFDNLLRIVETAQLDKSDIVKITVYVTIPGSVALYRRVREKKLGSVAPCATYLEIAGLATPEYLVEIEGEAVREAAP